MSQDKRMSKRQMKEDRLVSTTFRATEYVKQNQTPFIIGISALVFIFAVFMYLRWNSEKNRNDASTLLSQAEILAAMGQMDQYQSELMRLSDNYASAPAGKIATLRLANNYFDGKQYDKAETYFDKILSRYSGDKMLAAGASAGKAGCREMKSDFSSAAKFFKQAADNSSETGAPGYLLKAGEDFAKAGDKKSAKDVLDQIGIKYSNSLEAQTAKRTLAELEY
jgi:predicted negative regulator of RcsB-dependent stress response